MSFTEAGWQPVDRRRVAQLDHTAWASQAALQHTGSQAGAEAAAHQLGQAATLHTTHAPVGRAQHEVVCNAGEAVQEDGVAAVDAPGAARQVHGQVKPLHGARLHHLPAVDPASLQGRMLISPPVGYLVLHHLWMQYSSQHWLAMAAASLCYAVRL